MANQIPSEQQQSSEQAQASTAIERGPSGSIPVRRMTEPGGPFGRSFSLMRRLSEDMDRLFEDFLSTGLGAAFAPLEGRLSPFLAETRWPQLDVIERDGKLVIQADVPGLEKEDLNVEVRENQLCISGERRSETRKEEGGYLRTERTCGMFSRAVPLPEGAKVDTVSATFKNGVLEIEIEVPESKTKRRRIEVH